MVWLTELPTPLLAVQRYSPASVLLMLTKFQEAPLWSTWLSLPFSNTRIQVMLGAGLPDAPQYRFRSDLSFTERLAALTLSKNLGGTGRKKSYSRREIINTMRIVLHVGHSTNQNKGIQLSKFYSTVATAMEHVFTQVHNFLLLLLLLGEGRRRGGGG